MSNDHSTTRARSTRLKFDARYLVFGSILALATWLRFYDLSRTSLWFDEAGSWQQASLPFLEMLSATARDNYPPLHNIILHFTIAAFGDSEQALRVPSALLGVATIYVLYKFGALLWGRSTGLIAALLLTLSGFHVWYSTEIRMYALLAFTATAFVLTAFYAAERTQTVHPRGERCGWNRSSLHSRLRQLCFCRRQSRCSNCLADPRRRVRCQHEALARHAMYPGRPFSALGALPSRTRASCGGEGILDPIPHSGVRVAAAFQSCRRPLGSHRAWDVCASVIDQLQGCPWAPFASPDRGTPVQRSSPGLALIGKLALSWPGSSYRSWPAISSLSPLSPIFLARYLICSLPAFLLLAARGLTSLTRSRIAFAVCLGLAVAAPLPNLRFQAFERLRPDNRAAMREFSARYESSDVVLYAPKQGRAAH